MAIAVDRSMTVDRWITTLLDTVTAELQLGNNEVFNGKYSIINYLLLLLPSSSHVGAEIYFEMMAFIYSWCVCWRWWLWPSLLLTSRSFLLSVHLSYLCSRARRMNRAVLFLADLFIPPKEITGKTVLGQCWG